ncbi:MAG: 4Fe-4S binding protein [Desulfobacterales bacterium]|nr:4Fe-4S binding protein [Desulfobacterales bacterium]
MAKIEINTERCKGCGLCVTVCSQKRLFIGETINRSGYTVVQQTDDSDTCTGCAFCAQICPDVVFTVYK